MGAVPDYLLVHQVTIENLAGQGATGPVYEPPVDYAAFVDDRTRTVRAPDGRQLVSSTTVYLGPDADVRPEARVTTSRRSGRAVDVLHRDGGGLPTPDHIEIVLE